MSELKLNQIYKVKEGHGGSCGEYERSGGQFIKIVNIFELSNSFEYDILNNDKEKVSECWCNCFTEDDLELEEETPLKEFGDMLKRNPIEEEVKEKTINQARRSGKSISTVLSLENECNESKSLEDLEVGDEVIKEYMSGSAIKKIASKTIIYRFENDDDDDEAFSLEELKELEYQPYIPEIKVLSPSEAETLLEEKLGIKVKIKN